MRLVDKLLDYSVVYSFDKSGFLRHAKSFQLIQANFAGKSALVTGGTKGIGQSVVEFIERNGGIAYFTGRTSDVTKPTYLKADMAEWSAIRDMVKTLPSLDYLILNAGGMPDKLTLNSFGYEYQFASQVVGHYLLIRMLHDQQKLNHGAKIVWVTSGGMYLKQYAENFHGNSTTTYDKVAVYANTKRAQVILVQEMSKQRAFDSFEINLMHPGWVDTNGVREAIPGFRKVMSNRLRDSEQGADTICWLLANNSKIGSGNLYFDRTKRETYPFGWTKEKQELRTGLMVELESIYQRLFSKNGQSF